MKNDYLDLTSPFGSFPIAHSNDHRRLGRRLRPHVSEYTGDAKVVKLFLPEFA
jgi:hypothetical protein